MSADGAVPVEERVRRARAATAAVADYDQGAVDELARAVACAVAREERAQELARVSVADTGIGTVEDKYRKLHDHLQAALEETLSGRSVGRVDTDREGVIEVLKPVGVIGALTPTTNPASTAAFLATLAVKGRNAVVVSPPPLAAAVTERAVEYVRAELAETGAPPDLVQTLEEPSLDRAERLVEAVDLAHVTGSGAAVEVAERSGTPNYCAGGGNATAVVDATADLSSAASALVEGATYDNGAVCTSESNAVVDERVLDSLLSALSADGGYVCSPRESRAVLDALFDGDGHDRSLVARSAGRLAEAAGLDAPGEPDLLVLPPEGVADDDRHAREKLTPVLSVHAGEGFDDLLAVTRDVLSVDGAGHSCVLHTERPERAERLAREVDVCRAAVNQPGALALPGGPDNDLPPTFSLGTGVWGGSQLDRNLSYRQFVTATRVARPTDGESTPPSQSSSSS